MQQFKFLLAVLLLSLLSENSFAQSRAVFQSLLYPRSVTSSGLGEQGVASGSALDAMQYNPANLAYAEGVSASFFRNPFNFYGYDFPITTHSLAGNLGSWGSIGLEYTYRNFGNIMFTTAENPDVGRYKHWYERSAALGYALSLSDRVAVGVQVRYAWQSLLEIDHFLWSAGVSYKPQILSDRLRVGLSFMNFGTRIDLPRVIRSTDGRIVEESIPLPAQLNMGIQAVPASNDFFDIVAAISATKPFDKTTGRYNSEAQSSFKSLFNDWDDFPNDVTGHIGLGFLWHPIHLGGGVAFFQEMYFGFLSTGPKDVYKSYYTHGIKIGLDAYGVQASAAYAGRWFNNKTDSYLYMPSWFPWETFQFTLSTNMNLLWQVKEEPMLQQSFKGIIVSGGYAYGMPIGRMKESSWFGGKVSFLKNHDWSIEADFYIGERSAILSSFQYSRMTFNAVPIFSSSFQGVDFGIETVSFESGFRYHPLEVFHPLFVQASLGVIRMNPVYEKSAPRYSYKSYDEVALGAVVPVLEPGIVLMPKVGLKTYFMEVNYFGRIGGYNQVELGVKVGYRL